MNRVNISELKFINASSCFSGMFDYRSHNVHAPTDVESYALFVSHPELGSITKIIGDARPAK